jgi:hypothetical protein
MLSFTKSEGGKDLMAVTTGTRRLKELDGLDSG